MPVLSADYASVINECRVALGRGAALEGRALIRVIDVIQHAANTLDAVGGTAIATLATACDTADAAAVTSDASVQAWKLLHDTFATDATAAAGLSTTQAAAIVTQFGLLDVFTGGSAAADIVAAIAVAKTALFTPGATLNTAVQLANSGGIPSALAAATAATDSTTALTASAALIVAKAVAIAGGAATITDVTANNTLDGRAA